MTSTDLEFMSNAPGRWFGESKSSRAESWAGCTVQDAGHRTQGEYAECIMQVGLRKQARKQETRAANKQHEPSRSAGWAKTNDSQRHVPKPHSSSLNSPHPPHPPYLRATSEASSDAPTPRPDAPPRRYAPTLADTRLTRSGTGHAHSHSPFAIRHLEQVDSALSPDGPRP